MSSPAGEIEILPRASIDTVIGERPPSPKVEGHIGLEIQYETVAPRNVVETHLASPPRAVAPTTPLRMESLPHDQRADWEHIRAQLGIADAEEGRVDWERLSNQLGLTAGEEPPVNIFKQIAQALLILLTTPFMILHGVFKMTGVLCKSLGMLFSGLADLSRKLTYKPKKNKKDKNRRGAGPIQI